MKKLFTVACTMLLGASLAFAQASQGGDTTKTTTTTKHKHSHGKKATKKATKKSSTPSTTTSTPK